MAWCLYLGLSKYTATIYSNKPDQRDLTDVKGNRTIPVDVIAPHKPQTSGC
jgi:hypothetical protein